MIARIFITLYTCIMNVNTLCQQGSNLAN